MRKKKEDTKIKVLALLNPEPGDHLSQSQIARGLRITPMSVSRIVRKLEASRLIKCIKKTKPKRYILLKAGIQMLSQFRDLKIFGNNLGVLNTKANFRIDEKNEQLHENIRKGVNYHSIILMRVKILDYPKHVDVDFSRKGKYNQRIKSQGENWKGVTVTRYENKQGEPSSFVFHINEISGYSQNDCIDIARMLAMGVYKDLEGFGYKLGHLILQNKQFEKTNYDDFSGHWLFKDVVAEKITEHFNIKTDIGTMDRSKTDGDLEVYTYDDGAKYMEMPRVLHGALGNLLELNEKSDTSREEMHSLIILFEDLIKENIKMRDELSELRNLLKKALTREDQKPPEPNKPPPMDPYSAGMYG